VTSLETDEPAERLCALATPGKGSQSNLALNVRSQPVHIDGRRFLLLFLRDVTEEEERAALERVFYHDFNNILGMLQGASDVLARRDPSELATTVNQAAVRLVREMAVQRCIMRKGSREECRPLLQEYPAALAIREIGNFFENHPSARKKRVLLPQAEPGSRLRTDLSLLLRILTNMIINALEATPQGGEVRLWLEPGEGFLGFLVRNPGEIPADVAARIFQRGFSTKEQPGRGFGTFSMKLLGEEMLGGRVDFTTSAQDGTVFRFLHPLSPPKTT
jgi:signal transduction histidine kinase